MIQKKTTYIFVEWAKAVLIVANVMSKGDTKQYLLKFRFYHYEKTKSYKLWDGRYIRFHRPPWFSVSHHFGGTDSRAAIILSTTERYFQPERPVWERCDLTLVPGVRFVIFVYRRCHGWWKGGRCHGVCKGQRSHGCVEGWDGTEAGRVETSMEVEEWNRSWRVDLLKLQEVWKDERCTAWRIEGMDESGL